MFENLVTVTGQVSVLFLLMAVGYGLGKAGKLNSAGLGQMSFLLLYIVCPCVMIDCLQVERTPELIRELAFGGAIAVGCYLLFLALSLLFFRKSEPDTRDSLRFAMAYGNVGFMGVPLVESVLGSDALVYGALSLAAFNLTTWTLGVLIMGGKNAFSVKKAVLNPGVIGLLVSLALFLTGISLPGPVGSTVSFLSDLNTPLAMLVIGAQLAAADVAGAFRQPVLYLASGLKLILVPAVTAVVLLPLGLSAGLYCALVLLAATPVAGTTSIFAQQFGRDPGPAVQVITLSTLLSIVTLPVFAAVAQAISSF